jgi:tRNA-dihydrouridine synthase
MQVSWGHIRARTLGLGVLACCALIAATPVTSARASAASIKQVLKEEIPKIAEEEAKFLEALSEYEKTGDVTPVEESLDANIALLREVRREVAKQGAENKRVRRARREIKRALQRVIGAYRRLKTAFSVKATNPTAAKQKAKAALAAIKRADRELTQAAKLLA